MKWEPSPILVKEMRSTMRSGRTFASLTAFLLFLAGLSLIVYLGFTNDTSGGRLSADVGRNIFGILSFFELLMLCFVAPSLTTGAIAGEYQRQTFDMLMSTPLTPRQILVGKFVSSMSYLFLLMLAAIPINSVSFLFGGIAPETLLWWVGLMVTTVFLLGATGLMMSAVFRSMNIATAAAYGLVLFVGIIIPLLGVFVLTAFGFMSQNSWWECAAATGLFIHPGGSFLTILGVFGSQEITTEMVLPAALSLYTALGFLFFFIGENRLAALAGRRSQIVLPVLLCLVVIIAAVAYIIWQPVQALCMT